MERIMTMDEEDIIKLIAKSVGVDTSAVKLKMSTDTMLMPQEVEGCEEPIGMIDTMFKFYAKIELPITQIDGTPVEDGEIFYSEDGSDDLDDGDGSEC
jgi:hypothetical protein